MKEKKKLKKKTFMTREQAMNQELFNLFCKVSSTENGLRAWTWSCRIKLDYVTSLILLNGT